MCTGTQSSSSIPSFATSFHEENSIEERSTIPQSISNVPPEGTSLMGKQASSLMFTSTHMDVDERVTATRFEIAGRVFGLVPAQEFIDRCLAQASSPSAPKRPDHKALTKLEQQMSGVKNVSYIVGKTGVSSPTDHSTCAFTALCERNQKPVFLMDTWHITLGGQFPEHEFYEKLHKNKVTNTAQLMEGADMLEHKIIMHEAAEIFPKENFPKIRHYRSVLGDVGHDLRTFSSVKQLVKVIHDATIAYDDVFFGAGVLHRDISIENIIILDNGTGLLVDWDLCKYTNSAPESAMERTGTWQFAAARLLHSNDNRPPHNREDGLESFYHVLNWMALRHAPHSFSPERLTSEIQEIYDYSYRSRNGGAEGGQGKRAAVASGCTNWDAAFKNQPLAELLETVRQLVAVRYQREPNGKAEQRDIDRYQSKMNKLHKREEFTSLFAEALASDQDWVSNGARVDNKLVNLQVRYMPLYNMYLGTTL